MPRTCGSSCEPNEVRYIRRIEAAELFRRWDLGRDRCAREELVRRLLPLARKLAHRYRGAHEPYDDLLQVASLGLVKAIDRFDCERGTAFSSFAVPTILGELKRHFRDLGWSVHVRRAVQERALKVEEARRELSASRGRAATVPELAEHLDLEHRPGDRGPENCRRPPRTVARRARDRGTGLIRKLVRLRDERFELIEEGLTIGSAASRLPLVERRVLHLRFVEDLTQTEIAERIGVSQMQVSRLLRHALVRLRELVPPEDFSA